MAVLVWARVRRGAAAGLALLALSACASTARTSREAAVSVQVLAFNDLHGHLSSNTPGPMQTGCCDAVRDRSGTQVGWAPKMASAGGVEYLAAHVASLRQGKPYSFTVAAGDLVGASPLVSALFHDEPTIEAMRALRLDMSAVGNHEFDHGLAELVRLQYGRRAGSSGCHPVDGCLDGSSFEGASFQFLAANVFYAGTDRTILPSSSVRTIGPTKVAFIGVTLRDTPSIVTPRGVAGLEFRSEVDTANAEIARLHREQGVNGFVVLLHQGGRQTPSAPAFPGPADQPAAFTDINGCTRFSGPEVEAIARGLDAKVKVVVTGHSHEPYVCTIAGKLVTSAASFGRAVTDIELQVNRRTGEIEGASARNHLVTQDVNRDPVAAAILTKYQAAMAPRAGRVVGRITADILSARETPSGLSAAGEQAMGDIVADAMLEAASAEGGGAVAALTNAGGIRGGLLFGRTTGGERPGEVTYEEAFTVQPFGNALVVKSCTGQALYDALEQQFDNPTAGANRTMLVSRNVRYRWRGAVRPRVVEGSLTIDGEPVKRDVTYRVVVNSFLSDGGDGFTTFSERCAGGQGAGMDVDAFAAYLGAHSPLSPPRLERIERID